MRTITEEMQRAAEGEVTLLDGVRLSRDGRWVQILPDSDEPVFHIYAEAESAAVSAEVADRYVRQVRGVVERGE